MVVGVREGWRKMWKCWVVVMLSIFDGILMLLGGSGILRVGFSRRGGAKVGRGAGYSGEEGERSLVLEVEGR